MLACWQVSDFGLSMLFKPGQEQAVAVQHGTLAFMPPELLTSDIISYATDVYSFGILMWEMIASKVTPHASCAFVVLCSSFHLRSAVCSVLLLFLAVMARNKSYRLQMDNPWHSPAWIELK